LTPIRDDKPPGRAIRTGAIVVCCQRESPLRSHQPTISTRYPAMGKGNNSQKNDKKNKKVKKEVKKPEVKSTYKK
jgi:hypothetical protein